MRGFLNDDKFMWRVSKNDLHTCRSSETTNLETNYNSEQLAAVLRSQTALTTAVARGCLQLYARGDLDTQFVSRVIQCANKNRCLNPEFQTTRLKGYAKLLNESEVGTMKIHWTDQGELYGFTFAPRAERIMAESGCLLRCTFTDASHLKNLPFAGNIFSTIAMDVGMKLRPLAVTYLIDNESESSWKRHFETLKDVLPEGYTRPGILDVSDQDKGLDKARAAVMPEFRPFFCSNHRKKNVTKYCKAAARVQYERAVQARTMEELTRQIERFDPKLKSYVESQPLESQFPAATVNAGLPYCGHHTSNAVESWNNVMADANVRSSPPFEAAIQLVIYCVQKYHKDRDFAHEWRHECPPNILKRVDETGSHERAINAYRVEKNGDGIYLVSPWHMPAHTRLVNLNAPPLSRCSCGKERNDDGLPSCTHILACTLQTRDRTIYDMVPMKYSTRSWREGYSTVNAQNIFAPPTAELMATEAERIALPVTTKRPRGRPSAISLGKRRTSWYEVRRGKQKNK